MLKKVFELVKRYAKVPDERKKKQFSVQHEQTAKCTLKGDSLSSGGMIIDSDLVLGNLRTDRWYLHSNYPDVIKVSFAVFYDDWCKFQKLPAGLELQNLLAETRNKNIQMLRKENTSLPEKARSDQVGTSSSYKVQTNIDDKLTVKSSVNVNEYLRDLANRSYRGKIEDKMLGKIDEAILEKYAEIKQQGGILAGICNLYRQLRFCNPDLALYVQKKMLQVAKEQDNLAYESITEQPTGKEPTKIDGQSFTADFIIGTNTREKLEKTLLDFIENTTENARKHCAIPECIRVLPDIANLLFEISRHH